MPIRRLVHLVRHAHAEPRTSWQQPDGERPLSPRGKDQANRLADLDVDAEALVFTSPAVRCTSTVQPLAIRLGADLIIDNRLAEGADARCVVEWICDPDLEHDLVLCGHGDLLPEALRLLAMRGMTLDGPNAVGKGSVWRCTIIDGEPRHAAYAPPPA